MSNIAIRVENLGKRYRRGADAPYHRFSELLQRIPSAAIGAARGAFQRNNNKSGAIATADRSNEFWALKDVSFDVQEGDVLGVIGRNGAGKSTLLKILSRITEPTTGRFGVRGRLASLLEVGTGFHPELTGRENIYLSGTILGMSRSEIKRHFDEIVAFAEIEEALDTPVKRYSSGMYVRLGFAIAAHLQPEILIVDEVLAVGDAAFQKKCLGKMGDVAKSGRTVLFVSHNMGAVNGLCGAALLLNHGVGEAFSSPAKAIKRYQETTGANADQKREWDLDDAPGTDEIRLMRIEVEPTHGKILDIESGVTISIHWQSNVSGANIDVAFCVKTDDERIVFQRGTKIAEPSGSQIGVYRVSAVIPPRLLNEGAYRIGLVFGRDQTFLMARIDNVARFEILNSAQGAKLSPSPGVIRPELDWDVEFVQASGRFGL